MQHFFISPEQVQDDQIIVTGNDVNHMKNVLRMRVGEDVELNDGFGHKYIGEIREFMEESVIVTVKECIENQAELPSKIYLYQGFPKADKMELIVQKAVELGVAEVIPVLTNRTIVKLDEKKKQKKIQRFQSIAESAAKQAARGIIPKIAEVKSFKEALEDAKTKDHILIPYELATGMNDTRKIIQQIKSGESIAIFIGPEGGFERTEVDEAVKKGARPITLGKRILRTETAGLAVLSVLMFQLEDRESQ